MEQELFSTQEAAKKLGIKPPAFRMKALRAGFEPAKVIQGKGSPQKFWTAEQIAAIAGNARADVTETERDDDTVTPSTAEVTDISTIEPAPVVDTEALIAEPLDNKSLEQLAAEANLYTARGDKCLGEGLTFYFAAGRRLIEAKKRVGHGNWQSWLADNFSSSADTAENYMKIARRFGNQNPNQFRNLGLTSMIRLSALPKGTEQEFIDEQANSGKPVELQSAREIQKNVRAFKTAHATPKETAEEPTPDLSNCGEKFSVFGRETDEVTHDIEVVSETITQDSAKKEETVADDVAQFVVVTPQQLIALRELVTTTNDLQTLKKIHDSLLELAQEFGKVVLLTEAKIGELAQKK